MEKIMNLRQSFINANAEVRNQLAIQFEPLVNKIVAQQSKILKTDWNTLKSMGYEGLVLAMNQYDPERSNMNFTQYAAFSILNNIRNSSCEELHTVKITSYTQDQIKKGEIEGTTFATVSISTTMNPDADETNLNREMRYGVYETAKFANGSPMDMLYTEVMDNCNALDAECFFHYYGVCGYEEKSVMELAAELNVTSGRISQRVKKVVNFIKGNENLLEMLASLMEK